MAKNNTYWVGTDVGGTFTDMVVIDSEGVVTVTKSPTTPDDRSRGVLDAFGHAGEMLGLTVDEILRDTVYFAHGTTAATNALIERKGEPTALITTRGFGDTILMQRSMGSWAGLGATSGHYSTRRNPDPIVPRELIFEIDERVTAGGEELVKLNEDQVREAARKLKDTAVGAVAICFLWSMVDPAHEERAAEIFAEELPGVFCTISSEIAPVIGEYERTATTVINAYLGPVIKRYVGTLEEKLRAAGYEGEFLVMDSGGGVLTAAEAAERSIGLLMSGPAGGVLASAALGEARGYPNVITADMGGTSFDVGLIVGGEPHIENFSVTGDYHLASPRIQVTAIGSGGGSIAHVDEFGILKVGPESAGADPGPACYGRGGTRPTSTDADVVLGIIDPATFLGGRMKLDKKLAEDAVRTAVADPLGISVIEAASGIRSVADSQMADLLRKVTVEKGHDPREFAVFAYGGAGPTHAYAFAEEAGIGKVFVPKTATAHSAYGTVSSDRLRAFQISDPQRTPPGSTDPENHFDIDRINATFEELEKRCTAAFDEDPKLELSRILFFRFRRQTNELSIHVGPGKLDKQAIAKLSEDFQTKYEQIYGAGTSSKGAGLEINTFRVEGRVPPPTVDITGSVGTPESGTAEKLLLGKREVTFGADTLETSVYDGVGLFADLEGPSILEFPGTTIVIGPRQTAEIRGGEVVITQKVNESVTMATKSVIEKGKVDPVTFEVIRHRLAAITDEQAATLAAISGSPLVSEANDFNVGLYTADGSAVAMGRTVLYMASSIAEIVGYVIADCAEDPGINPGDVFIVNHPWKGGMHAMDMGVVAPIFHDGELVAWSGAMCHLLDVGGLRPSSFCMGATDMYQEGLQLPPTKLVDGGVLRSDVLNIILSHSRLPASVNLDMKGLIAANNTAVRAVGALIDRYGLETVNGVMNGVIELSEQRIRQRLEALPDATIKSIGYLDNDGAQPDVVYEIALTLTKKGDSITFDFSESSPQAPSYINCTWAGLAAGVAAAVLPTIAYDIPWNAGIFKSLTIECPEGLICNAKLPAAVSGGTLEATWLVEQASQEALSKLVACSDTYLRESQALPAGGPDVCIFSGTSNEGERFTQVMLDLLGTGGGAYADHDGVATQGQHNIERAKVSNAEGNELLLPIVYLFRGLVPDSGGAGKHRGGDTLGSTWTFLGDDDVELMFGGHGWDVPNANGGSGGHPGEENRRALLQETNVRELFSNGVVPGLDQLEGKEIETTGRFGMARLNNHSVYAIMPQAGGGWGDPLDRPASELQTDLEHRAISHEAATVVYGAVLDTSGRIDEKATAAKREELRAARKSWDLAQDEPLSIAAKLDRVQPLGTALEIASDGKDHFVRCNCGDVLCKAESNWREHARSLVTTPDQLGPGLPRIDDDFEIRQYACSACGALLSTDVRRKETPHLHDIELAFA